MKGAFWKFFIVWLYVYPPPLQTPHQTKDACERYYLNHHEFAYVILFRFKLPIFLSPSYVRSHNEFPPFSQTQFLSCISDTWDIFKTVWAKFSTHWYLLERENGLYMYLVTLHRFKGYIKNPYRFNTLSQNINSNMTWLEDACLIVHANLYTGI